MLEDWQKKFIRILFGWLSKDTGLRRYRTCYQELGRKNGKTTLGAAIALYMMVGDNEPGAEVLLSCNSREQCGNIFEPIAVMIENNQTLKSRIKCLKARKRAIYGNNYIAATAANYKSADGKNCSFLLCDELAEFQSLDYWQKMIGSQKSRRQPLRLCITTSGWNKNTICGRQHDFSCDVRDGLIVAPTHLPILFNTSPDDDWTSEATFRKANPNYLVSITKESYEEDLALAKESLIEENRFKRYSLSMWTSAKVNFLKMDKYDALPTEQPDLTNQTCFGGLDLSSTKDLTAFSLCFPVDDMMYIKTFFWIPRGNIKDKSEKDSFHYETIEKKQDNLFITEGDVVDYKFVEAKILELCEKYNVKEIAFDRWNSSAIVTNLTDKNIPMVAVGQGYQSMSSPTKELELRVLNGTINFNGCALMRWCASNVSVTSDPAGNIKPVKPDYVSSTSRIDGIVSSIMSLDRAIHASKQESIYNTRGMIEW